MIEEAVYSGLPDSILLVVWVTHIWEVYFWQFKIAVSKRTYLEIYLESNLVSFSFMWTFECLRSCICQWWLFLLNRVWVSLKEISRSFKCPSNELSKCYKLFFLISLSIWKSGGSILFQGWITMKIQIASDSIICNFKMGKLKLFSRGSQVCRHS